MSAVTAAAFDHLLPVERAALERLFQEAIAEGRELTGDPLAFALVAVAMARAAGHSIPAIVLPPEQMEHCL